ncbi:MAG: hypothetical protein KBS53_05090 [Bacteroidales bacterium]|nr:hypothetical protein [Candidatus Hennigimonas equi]
MRKEDRAGLQLTIIVHLVVLIVLLLWGIGRELANENSFVLDFSKQEEMEKQQEQEDFREDISRRLDDIISNANRDNPIRNVAVSSELRDDRHSSAEAKALMGDADRLARELKDGYKSDIEEDAREETVEYKPEKPDEKHEYSGPSVLSWTLEGRKASHLPIPAYRCYGAGVVAVAIAVDQQGKVVNAKVNDSASSDDRCLREFAIRAARLSRFNRDMNAPVRQAGEIVYSFIAQ